MLIATAILGALSVGAPTASGASGPTPSSSPSSSTSSSPSSSKPSSTSSTSAASSPPRSTPSNGSRSADPSSIRSAQDAVVTEDHLVSIDVAQLAVNDDQTAVDQDRFTLASDEGSVATAAATAAAAAATLRTDRGTLGRAARADAVAQVRLGADRARLRSVAVALYAAGPSGLQPTTLKGLQQDQEAIFGQAEVEVVGDVVVSNLHADVLAAAGAARFHHQVIAVVAADQRRLITSRAKEASAAAAVTSEQSQLSADDTRLASDQKQLTGAQASLTAALAKIRGPIPAATGGITLMGTSTLSAKQIAGWFNSEGYVDLTNASISELARWYLQAGTALGVRGDVAFAQAVIETGGFSSPDAVGLNNYAGIGHCDTCSSGWGFPSPEAGVIGQLQLLRIFAGGGSPPKGAPPPVLPTLVPSQVSRSGCCATWESLTGVWATDPTYAAKVLGVYLQMLNYAEGTGPQVATQSG